MHRCKPLNFLAAIILTGLTIFVNPGAAYGNPEYTAEPEPPLVERDSGSEDLLAPNIRTVSPSTEWIFHKTPDNQHPDENEQQLVWLMNRARSNPTAEGIWLATLYDQYISYSPGCAGAGSNADLCYVAAAMDYWRVDREQLKSEFDSYDTMPPAAFDVRLYRAAKSHSDYQIDIDGQGHSGQFDRIDDEGFEFIRARGNVFSYSLSAVYGHAGFNIDWGNDGGDGSGMQPSRGHRLAIMSIDGDYTNFGIAAVSETTPGKSVGPLVITGNYCRANAGMSDHYNRFLVGTVWSDRDNDSLYDPGEGIGNVTVMPDQGSYYALTSDSGGYALPITTAGRYDVTFSGGSLNENVVKTVMVGDDSVLLDLVDGSISASSLGENSGPNDSRDNNGGSGGGGCFISGTATNIPILSSFKLMSFCIVLHALTCLAAIRRKSSTI